MGVITDAILDGAIAVVNLLPESPFLMIENFPLDSEIAVYLRWLNYFIPVSSWVPVLEAWLFAIAIYYVYAIALRALNVIS